LYCLYCLALHTSCCPRQRSSCCCCRLCTSLGCIGWLRRRRLLCCP
jgi:hypothetical protein